MKCDKLKNKLHKSGDVFLTKRNEKKKEKKKGVRPIYFQEILKRQPEVRSRSSLRRLIYALYMHTFLQRVVYGFGSLTRNNRQRFRKPARRVCLVHLGKSSRGHYFFTVYTYECKWPHLSASDKSRKIERIMCVHVGVARTAYGNSIVTSREKSAGLFIYFFFSVVKKKKIVRLIIRKKKNDKYNKQTSLYRENYSAFWFFFFFFVFFLLLLLNYVDERKSRARALCRQKLTYVSRYILKRKFYDVTRLSGFTLKRFLLFEIREYKLPCMCRKSRAQTCL